MLYLNHIIERMRANAAAIVDLMRDELDAARRARVLFRFEPVENRRRVRLGVTFRAMRPLPPIKIAQYPTRVLQHLAKLSASFAINERRKPIRILRSALA